MKQYNRNNTLCATAPASVLRLINRGMRCYRIAPLWNFIWIPWEDKVIDFLDTKGIKRYFGIKDANFASEFIWLCQNKIKYLKVPAKLEAEVPMPNPEGSDLYPDKKAVLNWAQTILTIINQNERNNNAD